MAVQENTRQRMTRDGSHGKQAIGKRWQSRKSSNRQGIAVQEIRENKQQTDNGSVGKKVTFAYFTMHAAAVRGQATQLEPQH
eukprot:100937-Pelagomonas_calceolata.AAC.1